MSKVPGERLRVVWREVMTDAVAEWEYAGVIRLTPEGYVWAVLRPEHEAELIAKIVKALRECKCGK